MYNLRPDNSVPGEGKEVHGTDSVTCTFRRDEQGYNDPGSREGILQGETGNNVPAGLSCQ